MPPKRQNSDTPTSSKKKKVENTPPPIPADDIDTSLTYKTVQTADDYFPQLEDIVIFFKKGYDNYIEMLKQNLLEKYHKVAQINHSQYEFVIKNIEYVLYVYKEAGDEQPGTICRITLSSDNETHILDYNMTITGVIPFLILRDSIYNPAKNTYDSLAIGDIAKVKFESEIAQGTITEIDREDMFESINVEWPDGAVTRVSPWELLDCKCRFDHCFDGNTTKFLMKTLKFDSKGLPALDGTKCPYPILILTISRRLENHFYRSKASFLLDLNHIVNSLSNCEAKSYSTLVKVRDSIVEFLMPTRKHDKIEVDYSPSKLDTIEPEEEDFDDFDEEEEEFETPKKKKKAPVKKTTTSGKKAPIKKTPKKTPSKFIPKVTPVKQVSPPVLKEKDVDVKPSASSIESIGPMHGGSDILELISEFEGGNLMKDELPNIEQIAHQMRLPKIPKKKPNITIDIPPTPPINTQIKEKEETRTPTSTGTPKIIVKMPIVTSKSGKKEKKFEKKAPVPKFVSPPVPKPEIITLDEPTPIQLNFEQEKPIQVIVPPVIILQKAPEPVIIKPIQPEPKILLDTVDEMQIVNPQEDPIEDFVHISFHSTQQDYFNGREDSVNLLEDVKNNFGEMDEKSLNEWQKKLANWIPPMPTPKETTERSLELNTFETSLVIHTWIPQSLIKLNLMTRLDSSDSNVYYLKESLRIQTRYFQFPLQVATLYLKTDGKSRLMDLTINSALKRYHLDEMNRLTCLLGILSKIQSVQEIAKCPDPEKFVQIMEEYGFLTHFESCHGVFVNQTRKSEFTILQICSIEETFSVSMGNKELI